jgi:hypothetical protein
MAQHIGIGIGAGLVSALLFGVLLKATPLAILLYLVAPLPILIVGLGWSHKAALWAAAAGSLALGLAIAPFMGLAFGAYIALPAWWLAYLTLLGRETPRGLEWYPTGRLLGWIAATAALAFIAIAVLSSPNHAAFDRQLRSLAQTLVQARMPAPAPARTTGEAGRADAPPSETDRAGQDPGADTDAQAQADADPADVTRTEMADALARVVPAFAANGLALLLAFYLWASARIVKISGRLPRPWPDLPATAMPRITLAALGAALLMCLAPGYVGRPGRTLMLFGLYLILFVTQGIALVALTLFGLADTALDRRRSQKRPAP